MTAKNELRSLITRAGLTQVDVAAKLGITPQSFSRKINNRSDFKVSEIELLSSLLGIADKDAIFFARK